MISNQRFFFIGYEVVHLHFWRRYITWFGADAPKTCTNKAYDVILIIDFRHVHTCAAETQ